MRTHRMSGTRFFKIWCGITKRCNNPKSSGYYKYGARGIKTFWNSFEKFKDDMYQSYQAHVKEFGEKQTQIDRIDNHGNYCKENCRWVTLNEQARNKRNNRMVTFNGKTLTVSEWAKIVGIHSNRIRIRIFDSKWSIEKALTTKPIVGRNQYSK